MNFESFLINDSNQGMDFKGRTLQDIWNYSDKEIEDQHDFIQMIFPLDQPSNAVFHGIYLDDREVIENLRKNPTVQLNMIKSANWFLSFLERTNHWKAPNDHNHLRITRIIQSLRLLVSDKEADAFYISVMAMLADNNQINATSLQYWKKA